jgi:hypothetical protein
MNYLKFKAPKMNNKHYFIRCLRKKGFEVDTRLNRINVKFDVDPETLGSDKHIKKLTNNFNFILQTTI